MNSLISIPKRFYGVAELN